VTIVTAPAAASIGMARTARLARNLPFAFALFRLPITGFCLLPRSY
jgi:hypothetical protein